MRIRTFLASLMLLLFLAGGSSLLCTTAQAAVKNEKTGKAAMALTLHDSDGKIYKTYPIQGKGIKLPAMKVKKGYTFLGWSDQKNQSVSPRYQAGQVLLLTKNTDLYAVEFSWKKEPNISMEKLNQSIPDKYRRVIFVGDSRTAYMRKTLKEGTPRIASNVSFVAKGGKGLSWFKTEGLTILLRELKKGSSEKPAAVIFNLGINDLKYTASDFVSCDRAIADYMSYMPALARILKPYNCKLYYMSVNPLNSAILTTPGSRHEEDVRKFNSRVANGLRSYTYINSYTYLLKTGYRTDGRDLGLNYDDGLHYSPRTYKRIFSYCMKKIA